MSGITFDFVCVCDCPEQSHEKRPLITGLQVALANHDEENIKLLLLDCRVAAAFSSECHQNEVSIQDKIGSKKRKRKKKNSLL